MDSDAARASLERAFAFIGRGAQLAHYASDAFDAGDDLQRELFAREVDSMVGEFDSLPDDDREFILWVAFTRARRRRRV